MPTDFSSESAMKVGPQGLRDFLVAQDEYRAKFGRSVPGWVMFEGDESKGLATIRRAIEAGRPLEGPASDNMREEPPKLETREDWIRANEPRRERFETEEQYLEALEGFKHRAKPILHPPVYKGSRES